MKENSMEQPKVLKVLSIKELFSCSHDYVIPIYQRNYAWKEPHIVQLLNDINDYAQEKNNKSYYIGTLVVYERDNQNNEIEYETIDGQQRLTTLFILLSYLKNEKNLDDNFNDFKLNLKFEVREKSNKTLKALLKKDDLENGANSDLNGDIQQAYDVIEKHLDDLNKTENEGFIEDFKKYLLENVKILRVPVPKDTDLNHYFEIMNTRGEQLEKHEILKAKLLEVLKDDTNTYIFNLIWEACANMEKYVQYGFTPEQRKELFGEDWNNLQVADFDSITLKPEKSIEKSIDESVSEDDGNSNSSGSISTLISESIESEPKNDKKNDDELPERFTAPINFPNFLLQVLRIQAQQDMSLDDKQDIPLDDKRLLETFENHYNGKDKSDEDKKKFVKTFGFNLLKLKFLSDKYIIKREFVKGNDAWSLKALQSLGYYKNTFDDNNRQVLMLLSMFHVSAPTLTYKHWFNAALNFLQENTAPNSPQENVNNITSGNYIKYLEGLAKSYLQNRYLATKPLDYYDIIDGKKQEYQVDKDYLDKRLDIGTGVENFVFNYLDYLLWEKDQEKYKDFEFSFRSSVEHFYPQNPIGNENSLDDKILHDPKILHNFGNLCLISRSKNSKLSNYLPEAKKQHYKNTHKDSIKQGLMMEYDKWEELEIPEHGNAMKEILLRKINAQPSPDVQ